MTIPATAAASHSDAGTPGRQLVNPDPITFETLRDALSDWENFHHEGIVWHHPDGRMAKLKRRDFPKARS